MRVLVLGPVWGTPHIRRPVEWLLEQGHEVVFAGNRSVLTEPWTGYRFIRWPIAELASVIYSNVRMYIGGRGAIQLLSVVCIPQLKLLHALVRPDIVHVHWADATAYLCAKSRFKPIIISVWGSDINAQLPPEYRKIVGEALASADRVIVDARDMLEKCAALAGRAIPTKLLPLGIDTSLFRPGYEEQAATWRQELQIPEDAMVLVSVRAFMGRYGHAEILEAFARALPQLEKPAILVFKVFNCADPRLREEMNERIATLGITKLIRWMEEVAYDRLPALYAMADIIVNYPEYDAFPVTFIEAAACERRVISCTLPSYQGTFADKYFRMVPCGDSKALAQAMVDEVNQPPDPEKLSSGRIEVCSRFDESITSRELVALYNELTADVSV